MLHLSPLPQGDHRQERCDGVGTMKELWWRVETDLCNSVFNSISWDSIGALRDATPGWWSNTAINDVDHNYDCGIEQLWAESQGLA